MRPRRTARAWLWQALVLAGIVSGALPGDAMAQELVCNRTIVPGINLVTFPMITPLANARDVCAVFGKLGLPTTTITQFTGTAVQSFTCDQETDGFPLLASQGIGVRIRESAAPATGAIIGSHDPSQIVTVPKAGGFPIGTTIYAYPASSCSLYSTSLCREAGLTMSIDGPLLVRYGAAGTVDAAAVCISDPGFIFRVCGEGIMISNEINGPKSFVPRVQPCN
jgi:hypothetical protein